MSQFSYRGSPNLQCPAVTVSGSSLASSSPSPVTTVKSLLSGNANASAGSGSSSGSAIHQLSGVQQQQQLATRMAVTSGVVRPAPGSPTSSVSPSQPGHGVTATATSSGGGPPGGRCCDTGRPLFTDPISGQTVCSCQYDIIGGYQRLGGLPPSALSMYSAPYAAAAAAAASEGITAYFPSLGAEQPPFYTSTAAGLEGLKDNLGAGAAAGWPYPSVYHPYDAAFASYPFNGYGMDLNGARRKNATRETTSTLKAWLNEHKKNPYPTKGEKIMLAIITKMTLTQVSTWFANARRRLKKENKMTWEPRNRVEDEDNNNDDDDSGRKSVDDKDRLDSKDSGTGSSEDGERPAHRLDLLHAGAGAAAMLQGRAESEWSESRADSGPDSPECLYDQREPRHPLHLQHHQHSHHPPAPLHTPSHHHHHHHHHAQQQQQQQQHQHQHPAFLSGSHGRLLRRPSSPDGNSPHGAIGPVLGLTSHHHATTIGAVGASASTTGNANSQPIKPRIWSLADMASKDGEHHTSSVAALSGLTSVYANASTGGGGGKIVSPLASRLQPHHPLHPMHTGAQFVRPHPDFYRNFYGATHLGAGADMSLLETYSRTLGGLGGVIASSGAAPSGILTSSTMASSVAAAAAAAAAASLGAASSGSSSSTSSLATTNPKAFAINGNAAVNANATTAGASGVLLTAVSSGISPSSSSTASSGTSEQSPHPPGSHPPSELKSPGRV